MTDQLAFNEDDDSFEPWCRDFDAHAKTQAHEFCTDHQASWCRICEGRCERCIDDPHCRWCHCALNEEYHDWDCPNAE